MHGLELTFIVALWEWSGLSPDIPDTEVGWDDDLGGVRWESSELAGLGQVR